MHCGRASTHSTRPPHLGVVVIHSWSLDTIILESFGDRHAPNAYPTPDDTNRHYDACRCMRNYPGRQVDLRQVPVGRGWRLALRGRMRWVHEKGWLLHLPAGLNARNLRLRRHGVHVDTRAQGIRVLIESNLLHIQVSASDSV